MSEQVRRVWISTRAHDRATGEWLTVKGEVVPTDDYAALEAENAKLRAELERQAVPGDHTEQALVMVPVKPTQAMISAGWNVGLMGMDRDGPQAIYAAMLAAAPKPPVQGEK